MRVVLPSRVVNINSVATFKHRFQS